MKATSVGDALDRLGQTVQFVPEWDDVVARADAQSLTHDSPAAPKRRHRRRLTLALIGLAAALVPLAALAAADDWWFFSSPGTPAPASGAVVVRTGSWDGHGWQLVAYHSRPGELCFSLTPAQSATDGAGAGVSCVDVDGLSETPPTKRLPSRGVAYLAGSMAPGAPSYIVGPVIAAATEVRIYFANGEMMRTKTFAAPEALGNFRFYATMLIQSVAPLAGPSASGPLVKKLVGVTPENRVVACFISPVPKEGARLSACQ